MGYELPVPLPATFPLFSIPNQEIQETMTLEAVKKELLLEDYLLPFVLVLLLAVSFSIDSRSLFMVHTSG